MASARKFDVDALRLRGITALVGGALANPPQWLYGILRRWLPNLRLPEFVYFTKYLPVPIPRFWVLVTRYEDVDEVLSRNDVFRVSWSAETKLLNDGHENGTNFILGLDGDKPEEGGAEYDWQLAHVMRAFSRDDVAGLVVPAARDAATRIVDGCGGRLDAIEKLVIAVPIAICERYYGVKIPAPLDFAHWTIAMSGYLFGPPFDRPRVHETVLAGADLTRAVVDASIDREIGRAKDEPHAECATVLQRLAREHCRHPETMTRLVIRSFLMGMITGFVPTNTVAGGHIIEMLLSRPDFMAAARAAALAGDDDLLTRTLFEAMRFMPLNPGPWRQCDRDYTIAAGTWRATRIRKGRYVVAGTQSAMFDPRQVRNPGTFDPGRAASDSMLFGYRLHWCAGIHIARAQITQTLKPLLRRDNLRRATGKAGRLQLLGLFPEHLDVVFDA
jgi:cytochrome P450